MIYFEKGCRKKCKRQSWKALWVVLSSLFFKKKLKELVRKAVEMCLRVLKESNKSRFDRYSRQKQSIDHIPYYLSGLSRAHFSDNLSQNSCMWYKAIVFKDLQWTIEIYCILPFHLHVFVTFAWLKPCCHYAYKTNFVQIVAFISIK